MSHPLFETYPISGEVTLSTGTAPTPYRVEDGTGLIVTGTCDPARLVRDFEGQDVHPVLTRDGRGVMILFLCDFTVASLGPHHEFQIAALCAPEPGSIIPDAAAGALAALATKSDWGVLSLHLWNDTDTVLAYNTEYLGLEAKQSRGHVRAEPGQIAFDISDASGASLIAGVVSRPARPGAGLLSRLLWQMGPRATWAAARQPWATAFVINRKNAVLTRNGRARTMTAPDKVVPAMFDPAHDRLRAGGPLGEYQFVPRAYQIVTPFRFVYLHPDDAQPSE